MRNKVFFLVLLALISFACSSSPKPVEEPLSQEVKVPEENKAEEKVDEGEVEQELVESQPVQPAEISEETLEVMQKVEELLAENQSQLARQELEEALEDNSDPLLMYNLAILVEQNGELEKASKLYEQALQQNSAFSPPLLNLVRLRLRLGSDALGIAEEFASMHPENLTHQFALLEVYLATGKEEEVIERAQELLRKDEANTRLRYYMAMAHYQRERYRLAEYICGNALEIADNEPEIRFVLGLSMLALERKREAREAFQEAVLQKRDFPEAHNALGVIQYEERSFEDAEASFEAALTYAPGTKEYLLNLGNARKALGKGDDAKQAYEEAAAKDELWPDPKFSLGILYLSVGIVDLTGETDVLERLTKAQEYLERSKELWKGQEDELVQPFLEKTANAIAVAKAEKELEAAGQDETDPCEADPFACEENETPDPCSDDPFECEKQEKVVDPCEADPFECEEKVLQQEEETIDPCEADPFECETPQEEEVDPCELDPFECEDGEGK